MNITLVDVAFWGFGVAAIWFGWRVFRTDSMVRASFSLLAAFLNVSAMLVLLLAEYLGTALFFMMAVEMVVMALFMVAFMMNPAGLNPMQMVHQNKTSMGVGAAGALGLMAVAIFGDFPARPAVNVATSITDLGTELLGGSMLIFESAGVALLATMIGAVVLSATNSRYDGPADQGSHPPPVVPGDPNSIPGMNTDDGDGDGDGDKSDGHDHGGHQ